MTMHLSTPAAPKAAACGEASAVHFTFWRWKATCALCKATTAAVAFEKSRPTNSVYRADLPIRYSRLITFVRANGGTEEAILEFERDKNIACATSCPTCKADLSDPIAMVDVRANRMVFACPTCTGSMSDVRPLTAIAEVLTSATAGLLVEDRRLTLSFMRACFCPVCGRHFTDLVLPSQRVCGVKHRVCVSCR